MTSHLFFRRIRPVAFARAWSSPQLRLPKYYFDLQSIVEVTIDVPYRRQITGLGGAVKRRTSSARRYEEEHQETKWGSAGGRAKAAMALSRKMLLSRRTWSTRRW